MRSLLLSLFNPQHLTEFLRHDEFYSPLFFIIFGLLGQLAFWGLQSVKLRRVLSLKQMEAVDGLWKRFEERRRLLWVLVLFGGIWLLQVVVERAWAN